MIPMNVTFEHDFQTMRESFFENAQEAFAILDKDLNFIDINKSFTESLKTGRDKLIGKNIIEFNSSIKNTERFRLYQKVLQTGESIILDDIRLHPNLGSYTIRVSCFKVGEGIGLAILNITDLRDAIDDLETFIYKCSHDMRTPVSNIYGLIQLALEDTKDPHTVEFLNMIKHQTDRLDHIIHQLANTSRLMHDNKIIYLVDLKTVVSDVIDSFSKIPDFEAIKFTVTSSSKEKFFSDKSLLICILENIIDNAIKYRNHDIQSLIDINMSDEKSGVRITIKDNGIGIDDDIQKNVFKMFYRGTNKSSGSGLGLYTVKHFIKKLKGEISLTSEKNTGTTFSFYIPNVNTDK
ncbi:sensor histidine kinase [Cytophaga hutchinsonii ATCC 33406]|uniref:histidine kinase n=2 Tax=Cytophaga hutchinsonii TaxID=985 RepID=A0A6N4SUC8_CYTH3|nr:sensor histidine kinase [Cytophaga hutchinsonii ATCC 33406]SFX29129.1 hypothetical protein SAMN04487930_102474 [Cytophaga hutchinsonii ATCC 33406]